MMITGCKFTLNPLKLQKRFANFARYMKRILLVVFGLLGCAACFAQQKGPFASYLDRVGSYPFLLIDKDSFTLTVVDSLGFEITHYGVALGVNYGNKTCSGDHKTPEGVFKIKQLLNSRGLTHDFGDGKGPVRDAYGPWFLRLDCPVSNVIGIHGTHLPESIGTRATEGCVRLCNEDILDLKPRVHVGTYVIITPDIIQ